MARFEVTDKETGAFKLGGVGHRFEATPCVDANGEPTGEATCAVTAQSFKGCVGSGCHQTQDAARNLAGVVQTRIDNLAAQLKALVDQVRATAINANDGRWTVAEGADFNYQLAKMTGSPIH